MFKSMTILFLAMVAICSTALAADPVDELALLAPLAGTGWVGGYVGDDAPELQIVLTFESILDGHAVRYVREAPEVGFFAETRFFVDPGDGAVRFVTLTSRGIVGEGTAVPGDGGIVLLGENRWPDEVTEFRTELRLEPDGRLTDTFSRLEDGEWVRGHYQEFERQD